MLLRCPIFWRLCVCLCCVRYVARVCMHSMPSFGGSYQMTHGLFIMCAVRCVASVSTVCC